MSQQILKEIDHLIAFLETPAVKKACGDNGWPAAKVRQTYIDYFVQKHEHLFVPSSQVVPHDDPTLLFANAGMNQFKPIFIGTVDPLSDMSNWKRAANSQKCIRAGGKHNDLDDVGKDVYHHTFFEMLGNWSFGNYFKQEAIDMAWDLLTNVYGLAPERLYATYFEGDKKDGVPADEEAREIWRKYLPDNRIIPFDKKDNFWEMGETGPCGPCTEIHYDRIGNRDVPELVNMDDPDVLEIWNLVFMQFNRGDSGKLTPLPAKSVDTGMGFERLVSCLQDKPSNYDTDCFTPLFEAIQKVTGFKEAYGGLVGEDDKTERDMAYRVLADHIRTLTIAITDGAQPGNQGRNFVLKRVLRRAVRYGHEILGAEIPFLYKLVPVVSDSLGTFFPELTKKVGAVQTIIKAEEEKFRQLLEKGSGIIAREIARVQKRGETELSAKFTAKMWNSYGFPFDLVELIAEENKCTVDIPGYEKIMEAERIKSRNARKSGREDFNMLNVTNISTLKKNKCSIHR